MVLPMISVSGPPEQAGEAYGQQARQMIERNLDLYLRRFYDQAGLDSAAVTAAGHAFRAAAAAHHPRIAAMLDGVAAGAEVPPHHIFALNARTELLYGHQVPGDEGCTAIGVLGTHTATGHLLLGQNWDWHPDQSEAVLLLRTTNEHGHAVLTLAEAGMLAKTGLNSAGVGQCLTMLASGRDGLTDPPGVPYHVLARATLEADSLTWATRAACRSPRNASINLMLAQAGDPAHGDPAVGGELLDLELVPGDVGLLHPAGGMVTHANHLEAVGQVHDMQRDWGGSSLFRAARARRLLYDVVAAGKTTTDDLVSVFRDHASFPHAICRHVDERDTPLERSQTVLSVLMDLDARRFGVAAGPPCGHDYTWYGVTE
jgi:isopenicillin-N N-acyltransferase like protein